MEELKFDFPISKVIFELDSPVAKEDLPETLYHATSLANGEAILKDSVLRINKEGMGNIYFCDTPELCIEFMDIYGVEEFMILEISVDDSDIDVRYLRWNNDSPIRSFSYYKDFNGQIFVKDFYTLKRPTEI